MQINRFTLPNGLRVVHSPDTVTAMVAVDVLYDVGARDENPSLTGMAHLFEHLMFGGSENIPDFDGALSAAGGISNAWTSSDFTNFYNVLPAVNIETALWLESDRMLKLAFSPKALEVQRSVVIEEFKQVCLNRPYGDLDHALRSLAYKKHPYRYPVIGKEFSHIEKVTQNDVRNWFYSHYGPDNAVLSICGNVTFDQVRRLVTKWFGNIESRHIAPRHIPQEPLQTAPRHLEMSGDVPQTAIVMAYPMAPYGQPGYFEADIISDILANGRSSRFYRSLQLGTDLFTEVDASIQGSADAGLFLINARLRENTPQAEADAIGAITARLTQLTQTEVAPRELRRCINRLESNRTFSLLNYLTVAQTLAQAEMRNENPDNFMAPYLAITPASLLDHARGLFDPDRLNTLIYRPR